MIISKTFNEGCCIDCEKCRGISSLYCLLREIKTEIVKLNHSE